MSRKTTSSLNWESSFLKTGRRSNFNISDQAQKQKVYVKLKKQIVWRLGHYLSHDESH